MNAGNPAGKRIQVARACQRCASGKRKCSGIFPCERCIRLGFASSCSEVLTVKKKQTVGGASGRSSEAGADSASSPLLAPTAPPTAPPATFALAGQAPAASARASGRAPQGRGGASSSSGGGGSGAHHAEEPPRSLTGKRRASPTRLSRSVPMAEEELWEEEDEDGGGAMYRGGGRGGIAQLATIPAASLTGDGPSRARRGGTALEALMSPRSDGGAGSSGIGGGRRFPGTGPSGGLLPLSVESTPRMLSAAMGSDEEEDDYSGVLHAAPATSEEDEEGRGAGGGALGPSYSTGRVSSTAGVRPPGRLRHGGDGTSDVDGMGESYSDTESVRSHSTVTNRLAATTLTDSGRGPSALAGAPVGRAHKMRRVTERGGTDSSLVSTGIPMHDGTSGSGLGFPLLQRELSAEYGAGAASALLAAAASTGGGGSSGAAGADMRLMAGGGLGMFRSDSAPSLVQRDGVTGVGLSPATYTLSIDGSGMGLSAGAANASPSHHSHSFAGGGVDVAILGSGRGGGDGAGSDGLNATAEAASRLHNGLAASVDLLLRVSGEMDMEADDPAAAAARQRLALLRSEASSGSTEPGGPSKVHAEGHHHHHRSTSSSDATGVAAGLASGAASGWGGFAFLGGSDSPLAAAAMSDDASRVAAEPPPSAAGIDADTPLDSPALAPYPAWRLGFADPGASVSASGSALQRLSPLGPPSSILTNELGARLFHVAMEDVPGLLQHVAGAGGPGRRRLSRSGGSVPQALIPAMLPGSGRRSSGIFSGVDSPPLLSPPSSARRVSGGGVWTHPGDITPRRHAVTSVVAGREGYYTWNGRYLRTEVTLVPGAAAATFASIYRVFTATEHVFMSYWPSGSVRAILSVFTAPAFTGEVLDEDSLTRLRDAAASVAATASLRGPPVGLGVVGGAARGGGAGAASAGMEDLYPAGTPTPGLATPGFGMSSGGAAGAAASVPGMPRVGSQGWLGMPGSRLSGDYGTTGMRGGGLGSATGVLGVPSLGLSVGFSGGAGHDAGSGVVGGPFSVDPERSSFPLLPGTYRSESTSSMGVPLPGGRGVSMDVSALGGGAFGAASLSARGVHDADDGDTDMSGGRALPQAQPSFTHRLSNAGAMDMSL